MTGPRPTAHWNTNVTFRAPPDQKCQLWGYHQAQTCLSQSLPRPEAQGLTVSPAQAPQPLPAPAGAGLHLSRACGTPWLWASTRVWANALAWLVPMAMMELSPALWVGFLASPGPGPRAWSCQSDPAVVSVSGRGPAILGTPLGPALQEQPPSCSLSWMQELLHTFSLHSRNAALRKGCGFSLQSLVQSCAMTKHANR